MEALAEFLPLVLVGLYYLFNARRRKVAQQRQRETMEVDQTALVDETRARTPFQEFMRQMETAMQEANGVIPVEPASGADREPIGVPPTPEARLVPKPVPTRRPISALGREFKAAGGFESERAFESAGQSPHQVHGYGAENPFSEDSFEGLARGRDVTKHAKGHMQYDPHGVSKSTSRKRRTAPVSPTNLWRTRLRDPRQAQEALVLTEIFNGPWKPRHTRRK